MITRDQAKKLADETIFGILLQTNLNTDSKGFSEVDALCYAFSALIMQRAFPKVNLADDSFDIAVAAQCTTLACAIDAGALSKQYIYNSLVNLLQEWEETAEKMKCMNLAAQLGLILGVNPVWEDEYVTCCFREVTMTYQEFAQRWSEIAQYPCEITYELGVGGEYDATFYENVDFNGWKPRKNLVCVLDYDNFQIKDPDYGFNASMFRLMAELLETPEDERGK